MNMPVANGCVQEASRCARLLPANSKWSKTPPPVQRMLVVRQCSRRRFMVSMARRSKRVVVEFDVGVNE